VLVIELGDEDLDLLATNAVGVHERLRDAGHQPALGVEVTRRLLDGHDRHVALLSGETDPAGYARATEPKTAKLHGPAIVVRMRVRDGLRDIESRADCERLVRAFYGRALEDPIIGFIFVDVAKLDLEAHVPQITSFWETILLGAQSYGGGAFRPHAQLHAKVRLRRGHFERWLALWFGTVDELFAGDRANLAKTHALRVGHAFHRRLQELPSPADPPATPTGLTVTQHGSRR
jgi:hemoglobin